MNMQRRNLEIKIRAADSGRTFTGIGVPYGETINLWGERERFEPGAISLDPDSPALVLWRHDEPIGVITEGRDTETGYEITGRLSDTARGREAATLLADGVISRLSIGFQPEEYKIEAGDDHIDTIVHTKVRALEFSLVPFPAYSQAKITDVRENNRKETPTMTTTTALTRADIDPLETALQDVERELSQLKNTQRAQGPHEPYFRSIGDYLKKVATGDETALQMHRDFAGQTTDGIIKSETYLGEFITWVQDRRKLINLFDSGALPAKGMSVEYVQLKSETLQAGKQTAEGENLPGPGEVKLATKSAAIDTYGGWTQLSRQLIERSELPYLDSMLKALGLRYAKATNDAMRTAIQQTITSQADQAITLPATATIYDWRDAIIDAAQRYSDTGFTLEGLLVSTDMFKALQRLEYANVPALTVRPGDEFSGSLNLPAGDGDIARLPVTCMFGETPAGTAAFYDSSALKTLESGNAPVQLQDDNIINLSRAFSLYGYLTVIAPFPAAIVPVKAQA
ncbi:HK97 family phage prohead protease [Schaalia sp. ZJ1691]|uniref:HK97 family phage prohead protease n=1 Tax=Schaalia sp. ZJ1691 TaxID=2709404 RepID=UPI0013ED7E9D|nr:HK97 family phage prohead protease [Schaalia sp. ZJ1691]